jgi:sortase A
MESSVSEEPPIVTVETAEEPVPASTRRGRRGVRRLGTALIVFGVVALIYGATIYFWRDPVTDLWARWKQSQLTSQLEVALETFDPSPTGLAGEPPLGTTPPPDDGAPPPAETNPVRETDVAPTAASSREVIGRDARRFATGIEPGDAIGQLIVPRLDIDPIVVNGTEWGRDLSRGPGRYPETELPGMGRLTAIAGHRTTFGAFFRHIDDLRPGDPIQLVLPYGTFRYEVVDHEIVDDLDWSIIEPRDYEALVLSACHPLYGASQRWIVYAKLVEVEPPGGVPVTIAPTVA